MVFIFIKFSPKFPAFFAKLSSKSWLPSTKFGGDRGQTLDGIPELHLFRGVSEVAMVARWLDLVEHHCYSGRNIAKLHW